MSAPDYFDLPNSPLKGTNLIEASAGTGKTYTIAGLFLRLVLEKRLAVNEILVVTFTEAATNELKERIRTRLLEAIDAFSAGGTDDVFLNDLVKKRKDSNAAIHDLKEALRAFDQAAIFTIHGFCRRMLHENAFESGSLFDTELVVDQESLKKETVDDFWRKHLYKASPLFANYVINNKWSPKALLSLLANRTAQPYLKIIPDVKIGDTTITEDEFRVAFNDVSRSWHTARSKIEKIISLDEGLNRNKYRKNNIPIWIRSMDNYVVSTGNDPALFKGFEKFTASELEVSVKNGYVPPVHPFFELCERLKQRQEELEKVFERRLLGLKVALFEYSKDQFHRRKKEKNIQFFDDLLLRLHRSLKGNGGEKLASAIRRKFAAALIDEFQDTDPLQYAIFKRIFNSEKCILFFIGDPKQAIYGFRGADIFAYMTAKKDVSSRYTLRENWRSEPDLIAAINAVFGKVDYPFVYGEIPFQPASAAANNDLETFRLEGQSVSPLQLWFFDSSKLTVDGKTITKSEARERISEAVAREISRLLGLGRNRRVLLGKRPLMEADIAVLVRTNAEARLMQKTLAGFHIPSVLYSADNLFDSHEALEMERVLFGIVDPRNERRIKAALATDMMGLSGECLDGLMEDEPEWEKWLEKFRKYHDLWSERGFIQMFRYMLVQEKVLLRLMSFSDGERRCTNVLHLSEVLHRKSVEKKLGIQQVLKWFIEQRDDSSPRLEEHQLRLESDEHAIKLVTVHKSKGLEYPVVFCPFSWTGSRISRSKNPFTFHDSADDMRLTLDLGSERRDINRIAAEKELLAENLRLQYVALTRAKNRCYLVWGRFKDAESSAPAYLFHKPELSEEEDIVGATGKRFEGLTDKEMLLDLKHTVDKACGAIELLKMPLEEEEGYTPLPGREATLSCRRFSGNIDQRWRISSFSSLISGRPHGDELPDRDASGLPGAIDQDDLEDVDAKQMPASIFAFPKGVKAGIFLHDVLEHLDFTAKEPEKIQELVAEKLEVFGFESGWLDTVCDMIKNVLSMPLDPFSDDLRLSRIPREDRLNELEFYFPLKTVSPEKLNQLFQAGTGSEIQADYPEILGRLQFAPTRGFMRGFMDLVFRWRERFYLVDWKSNYLGNKTSYYDQESLASTMKEEVYFLQYHIYTLALDQYLQLRLPGYNYKTHFGGVFYIFLRGVNPQMGAGFGIYRDLPSPELIKALRDELIEKG